MDRGRRACTAVGDVKLGCSLRIDMDLKNSRCVIAVSACRRWVAAADLFHAMAACEGRSGEPAAWDDGMIG